MKNILLSFSAFLLFVFAIPVSGQIKVNSSGKVGVGGWSASNSYEIAGYRSYFTTAYSAYDRTSYNYVYESAGIGASYSSEYTLIVNPTTNVQHALYISDGANRSSGTSLYVNGDAASTGGWFTFSDRRMKKRERRILRNNVLSKLTKIHGKRYEYKSKDELLAMHNAGLAHFSVDTIYKTEEVTNEQGRKVLVPTDEVDKILVDVPKFKTGDRYGVVAQEVLAEYPELVSMDEASGMYIVDYQGFIPLLLEGFSLQQEQLNEMKGKIRRLKNRVKALEDESSN